jgi:hypothetical protein
MLTSVISKEFWFWIRLAKHTTKGIPLWDGKAKLKVRPATDVEAEP